MTENQQLVALTYLRRADLGIKLTHSLYYMGSRGGSNDPRLGSDIQDVRCNDKQDGRR